MSLSESTLTEPTDPTSGGVAASGDEGGGRSLVPEIGPLHVAAIAAVVVALVLVLLIVAWRWTDPGEATAVLGVVYPAIVSVGLAVLGVPVAYSKGKEAGTALGERDGTAAGRAEGVQDGRRQVARELRPTVLAAGEPGDVVAAGVSGAQASLARLRGQIDDILAE